MFRTLVISLLFVACANSTALPPVRKPDGSWHLKCGATLDNCVKQAEDLCKGRGYVVVSGMSKVSLYGAELGASRYEVREAELDIACADQRRQLPTVVSAPPPQPLPQSAPPAQSSPPPQPPAQSAPSAQSAPPPP